MGRRAVISRLYPVLAIVLLSTAALAAGDDDIYHRAFYQVASLNDGLPTAASPVNLQTPQAALENFILASRQGDFARAAHSLNLNLIPQPQRAERAPQLAQRLFYIVNQTLWIDWDDIPDTPEAEIEMTPGGGSPVALQPRRTIALGRIALGARSVDVRLARVRPGQQDPVWVISSQAVDNIDALYQIYGPGILDRHLPDWMKVRLAGKVPLWEWAMLGVFAALGVVLGWMLQKLVLRVLRRTPGSLYTGLAQALSGPLATLIAVASFSLASSLLLSLSGPFAAFFRPAVTLLTVAVATWAAMTVVSYFAEYFRKRYVRALDSADEPRTRQLLTQISVARRVLLLIAFLVGVGVALNELDVFETLGWSLLASAGAATVILGIAAQNVLGNLMAGIQIALTRLVNIGDNVMVAGEWGYVEEITYTYITVRTWDQRRLIVPLKRLLEDPMENWSKTREHLLAPVFLYVDYRADIERIRAKCVELVHASEDWSGEAEPSVLVTDLREQTMELRVTCSARDADAAWRLHCWIRERLVRYVQDLEDGAYLPRRRVSLEGGTAS